MLIKTLNCYISNCYINFAVTIQSSILWHIYILLLEYFGKLFLRSATPVLKWLVTKYYLTLNSWLTITTLLTSITFHLSILTQVVCNRSLSWTSDLFSLYITWNGLRGFTILFSPVFAFQTVITIYNYLRTVITN